MRTWSILIFMTLLLVVLPLTSLPQSQPPSPRPLKTSQEQQNKAEPKKAESKYIQKISDKPPLVVKVVPAPSADHEKANDAKTTDKKSSTNWWNILFDGLLVLFTGILAWSTVKLWRCTEKSADLTYKAFIATNRPRLRIRRIFSYGVSKDKFNPPLVYISNVGESDASNIEPHAVFPIKVGSVRMAPWTENLSKSIWHGPTVLKPGEEASYDPRFKIDLDPWDLGDVVDGIKTLLIIGEVTYQDANRTTRKTAFGWTYDLDTGEFSKPAQEDQYNYED